MFDTKTIIKLCSLMIKLFLIDIHVFSRLLFYVNKINFPCSHKIDCPLTTVETALILNSILPKQIHPFCSLQLSAQCFIIVFGRNKHFSNNIVLSYSI